MSSEAVAGGFQRLFVRPVRFGRLWLPAPGLLVLSTIGAMFLLVIAVYRWPFPQDELSYYIGARRLIDGVPLYDPTATVVTPFAYRYPPPLAQFLVPFALVMSPAVFTATWTVLLMGCLWWMAGRDIWVMLALIAFPPVAVELWYRNVHIILAVLLVLAIRRWSGFYAIGAAIKVAPGLGIAFLAAGGRWRAAGVAVAVGLGILVVSVALSPAAWAQFIDITRARGPLDETGFVAVPYLWRFAGGLVLAIVAGRLRPRLGEPLLVIAVTLALPTLWFTALATLVALYPVIRTGRVRAP
jgi:hypothetical protein